MFELSGPVFVEIQGIKVRLFCGLFRNLIVPSVESIGLSFLLWAYIFVPGGGGGVLPCMGYIGICRCEGYGFQAVYSRIGYMNQSVWV